MKKIIIIVLCVILGAGVLIWGITGIRKGNASRKEVQVSEEQAGENTTEELKVPQEKSEEPEDVEEEETLAIRLSNLPDEALSVMGVTKSELAEALKKWTEENGYTSVVGAEFYDPMWIRFSEGRYSMDCRLLTGTGGNGIQEESDTNTTILTLEVFRNEGQIQFHR